MSVLFKEWAGLLNGRGDWSSVDGEQFTQDCLGTEFALVEEGGQDAVGIGKFGAAACSRGPAALGSAALGSAA